MRLVFLALIAVLSVAKAGAGGYVANAYGVEGKYQIFEFTEGRNLLRPVSGGAEAAWPSAVRIGSNIEVFATERVAGRWDRLHRWLSNNGAPYVDGGVVITASADEPYGIGPSTVTHGDGIYRLYYLIRGAAGPGVKVGLATSMDGVHWSRHGEVYEAGADAAGGLSVSYVCSSAGRTYLFMHAYGVTLASGSSIVASASSPDGPFGSGRQVLQPSGRAGTLTGMAGNAFATFTGSIRPGTVIVVLGAGAAAYVVEGVTGSIVYLDRPLSASHDGDSWADVFRAKIDLSFAIRHRDGSWSGAATGYGQFPGVLAEFTTPMRADGLFERWTVGPGYFLSPYFNSGNRSTENPEPIRSNASCAAEF